jgi:uncharacterized Zn-binding protein involved in type VI secretion
MKPVTRLGDLCTGHGCFPSRPNTEASGDVFINNLGAHRFGDGWAVHCCVSCHDGKLQSGSKKVFVNGKELARVDDPVDCGSFVQQGSDNVFAG